MPQPPPLPLSRALALRGTGPQPATQQHASCQLRFHARLSSCSVPHPDPILLLRVCLLAAYLSRRCQLQLLRLLSPLPQVKQQTQTSLTIDAASAILLCPGITMWGKERCIAGLEVKALHPSMFLFQSWNSYWLRWIARGKEAYFCVARTKPAMVLVGELLAQLRHHNVYIDAAATTLAVQTQKILPQKLSLSISLLSSRSLFLCRRILNQQVAAKTSAEGCT